MTEKRFKIVLFRNPDLLEESTVSDLELGKLLDLLKDENTIGVYVGKE